MLTRVTIRDRAGFSPTFVPLAVCAAGLFAWACGGRGEVRENAGSADTAEDKGCVGGPEHCDDAAGTFGTIATTGSIDRSNEFFQDLGTNGRSCNTCHREEDGWTVRPDTAQKLFDQTDGLHPLFRSIDGANNPNADVSTVEARRQAYSLLLRRGTFRVEFGPLSDSAEFTIESVDDPNGIATPQRPSVYRRPMPTTNLTFVVGTAIMWDGREPSLASQANDATLTHAQSAVPLTEQQQKHIVDFETSLFTAQTSNARGDLLGVGGGPTELSRQPFALNANSPDKPPKPPLVREVFTLFRPLTGDPSAPGQAILRGQTIFNSRVLGVSPIGLPSTCTSCHASFNTGNNDHAGADGPSLTATGTGGDAPNAPPEAAQFLASDLPVYTLKNKATGAIVRNNDPGQAFTTGKWLDVGRFKPPVLRGVAARAPYFHHGMAKTLLDVVNFYDKTKAIPGGVPLSDQEKADLVAFLESL